MSLPNITWPDDPATPRDHGSRPVRRVALVLVTRGGRGGKERVVAHLAAEFVRLGLHPLVISLLGRGDFTDRLQAKGIPVAALGSARRNDLACILRLARLLVRFSPDVVNVHDRSSLMYAGLANALAARRPIVLSCHGLLLKNEPGERWVERLAMRGVRAVTAVSKVTAADYTRLLGWTGGVEIVPNGVPAALRDAAVGRRMRQELGLSPGTFVLLAVGNINPEKGYEDLLDAVPLWTQSNGLAPRCILIAGSAAEEAYRQTVIERARQLGLAEHVRFIGFREDVQALFSAADAFVLPSRKEGLPMALLEAMASGLPVVATRVGGIPDVLRDGVNGLLVPPDSPGDLARALARLEQAEPLRQRLGTEAQRQVQTHYGTAQMAHAYLRVYLRACGDSAAGIERDRSPSLPVDHEPSRQRPGFLRKMLAYRREMGTAALLRRVCKEFYHNESYVVFRKSLKPESHAADYADLVFRTVTPGDLPSLSQQWPDHLMYLGPDIETALRKRLAIGDIGLIGTMPSDPARVVFMSWVARHDFALLTLLGAEGGPAQAAVKNIWVAPAQRRQGVAQRGQRYAETLAWENGIGHLWAFVMPNNHPSIRLHEALRYERWGEIVFKRRLGRGSAVAIRAGGRQRLPLCPKDRVVP